MSGGEEREREREREREKVAGEAHKDRKIPIIGETSSFAR